MVQQGREACVKRACAGSSLDDARGYQYEQYRVFYDTAPRTRAWLAIQQVTAHIRT